MALHITFSFFKGSDIGNDLKYTPSGRVPFQIFAGINKIDFYFISRYTSYQYAN